jgi:hypothetical protein
VGSAVLQLRIAAGHGVEVHSTAGAPQGTAAMSG